MKLLKVVDIAERAQVPYLRAWRFLRAGGRLLPEERERVERALRELLAEGEEEGERAGRVA